MATQRRCPSCLNDRDPRKYLCRLCWGQLPTATRTALNRRGNRAAALERVRELYRQIDAGVQLADIRITA